MVCLFCLHATILRFCLYTVKPDLNSHSKIDKQRSERQVVTYCGSKVLQNASREHFAILLVCVKRLSVLKTYFGTSVE